VNLKEIKELIELITEKGITEFELERAGVKVRLRRGNENAAAPVLPAQIVPALPVAHVLPQAALPQAAAAPAHAAAAAGGAAAQPQAAPVEELHPIKAPIVGTFYESPSPDAPPFVRLGDTVEAGQVLCIIEAMKLMNEIESDVAGEVVRRFVDNAQPVEYGEPLFAIRPKK